MTDKRTETRTETHVCDYISILSELRSQFNCFDEAEQPYYHALSEAIKVLSAQPEEAEWIPVESDVPYGLLVECSNCGTRIMINDALEHKYCSECGAKMKKG